MVLLNYVLLNLICARCSWYRDSKYTFYDLNRKMACYTLQTEIVGERNPQIAEFLNQNESKDVMVLKTLNTNFRYDSHDQ